MTTKLVFSHKHASLCDTCGKAITPGHTMYVQDQYTGCTKAHLAQVLNFHKVKVRR